MLGNVMSVQDEAVGEGVRPHFPELPQQLRPQSSLLPSNDIMRATADSRDIWPSVARARMERNKAKSTVNGA